MAELNNTATKSDGEVLMDEIIYGKRKTKIEGEPAATKTDGEELMDEILYGKKKATTATTDEPPKKKGFNRDDYFGI